MAQERGGPLGPFEEVEVIRVEAGMPTARFCLLVGIPERSYRRFQARRRAEAPPRGPWPTPRRRFYRGAIVAIAERYPAWGHRKVWALARHDGHQVTTSTVLRILDDAGLVLKADYQRERREHAKTRKAVFARVPTGPNEVWQLDFSEYETTTGGVWRAGGVADYYSKYEFGWRPSPTANQHDAVATLEAAIAEAERLAGVSLAAFLTDPATGEIRPIVVVTDNGGPFRSFRFEAFITSRPELCHVRTRVRSPGQNGVRERAFGSLKYECLYRAEITDAVTLDREAEAFRIEFNTIRPHEALAWNRPLDVHQRHADPTIPTFQTAETLPIS